MTRVAGHRFVDRIHRLEAIETLEPVRSALPRCGIDRLCAGEAGTASRTLPHTA